MKRRILAGILTLVMLMSQVAVRAEEKRASLDANEQKMAGQVLSELEILEYSEANQEDIISRIDFAVFLGRLLKVNEYELTDVTYYTDIEPDHYGAKSINYLTEMGAFTGYGNSEFKPNEPIAPAEAVKAIFNILGYKTYAEFLGGYPEAYLELSEKAELLDGFEGCKNLTRGELSVLLFRSGLMPMMEITSISGGNVTFDSDESETAFERYWDIYEEDGIITTAGDITLNDSTDGTDGYLSLNDEMYYYDGTDAEKLLGRYVKAICKKAKNEKEEILYAAVDSKKTEEIYIAADDIVSYNDYVLQYYEGSREKKEVIATDAVFIHNGTLAEYGIDGILNNIDKGDVYLIDVTGDNKADTVIISEYKTYVVGHIDSENEIIYDELSGKAVLSLENFDHKKFYSAGGGELQMEAVAKGAVISVKESKAEYADVFVSNAVVSGKVTEVFSEEDKLCVRVDDKVYVFDKNYILYSTWFTNGEFNGEIGESYTFALDMFGDIAYISGYTKDAKKPGYVIDIKVVEDADETVLLKVLKSDGKVATYHTAEKTEVDGIRYQNAEEIKNAVLMGDGKVIVYKENKDGKIIYIDTTYKGENENNTSLCLATPLERASFEPADARYPGCRQWFKSSQSYSGVIVPSTATVIFSAPEDAQEKREDYFRTENWTTFPDGRQMKCQSYKLGDENFHDDIVVEFNSSGAEVSLMADLFVISGISQIADADSGVAYKIDGYTSGRQTSYIVEDGIMERNFSNESNSKVYTKISQLKPGSIVQLGINALGRVSAIRLLVDYSEDLNKLQSFADNNYHGLASNSYVIARVYCNDKKKEGFELSYQKGGDTTWKDIFGTPTVTVVDTKSERGDMVRSGLVDDIPTYKMMGDEIYPMFVYAYRMHLRDIVVYK